MLSNCVIPDFCTMGSSPSCRISRHDSQFRKLPAHLVEERLTGRSRADNPGSRNRRYEEDLWRKKLRAGNRTRRWEWTAREI